MLVAVAFHNAENARKIADALGRCGMRAVPMTSGAAVLRQLPSITCVVCGLKLDDMTAARLRRLLPPDRQMLLLAPGAPPIAGVEALPAGMTRSQLAERVLRTMNEQEAAVARAQRLMIRKSGLDEAGAHRLLQKKAMNGGLSLYKAAMEILQKYGEEV